MSRYTLWIHPEASEEAEHAGEWYRERSLRAAAHFREEVARALQVISQSPGRGPSYLLGTRRFLLWHFPYALVYRELSEVIQVLAVAHGRRRPGYWKARLR